MSHEETTFLSALRSAPLSVKVIILNFMTKAKKIKVGILGTGNIGTDLLIKIQRSGILECGMFSGQNLDSPGIKKAKSLGVQTSFDSIQAFVDNPDCCDIVIDATSARSHYIHAPILRKLKKFTIDMTPSQVGKACIPVLNMKECLDEMNVNLITCGGQAAVPVAWAITRVHPEVKYIEIVASIASCSAGRGTRLNIDEFTQATKDALKHFSGVADAKAIIILNPACPPILMHNTVYALINQPKLAEIKREVTKISAKIREYVPGYKITLGPVVESGRVTIMIEATGQGDFLPKYSGNLDIVTSAAVKVAEEYAKAKLL